VRGRKVPHLLILNLLPSLLLAPLAAGAQEPTKVPRVGYLSSASPSNVEFQRTRDAFLAELRKLGYGEGQNIRLEYRWAEGTLARFPVDVILTAGGTPAALAAKEATTTIPVVFVAVGDPVGSQLVASLARPGGNVTGLTHIASELDGKRLELLKEVIPKVHRVAVLWDPEFPPHGEGLKVLRRSAGALRVELQPVGFRGPEDLERGVAAARGGGAGALLVLAHPLTAAHARRLAGLTEKSRLPAISQFREFAEAGGLMAYGTPLSDLFRRAAVYVDKILKGAKPGDLPVEQPTKFELVINLKTAKALGLKIPQSVLIRADEVIQ